MSEHCAKSIRGTILVIEDTPESLELLEQLLEKEGYAVRLIPEASLAVMSARTNPPDLILLDIMMPEMDGYDVCWQLKSDEATRDIPVIFISALDGLVDKIKAFSAGGVDYITKPFQREEVLARISTHLRIRNLQKQLAEANQHLEQRVLERTEALVRSHQDKLDIERQLQQAQKTESLGLLAGGIAHDFNNVLFGMIGYLQLTLEKLPKEEKVYRWTKEVFQGAMRASDLVNQILTFSRRSDVKLQALEIHLVVSEALKLVKSTLPASIRIRQKIDKKCGTVMADPTQIHQIAMNLITNAYHAMQENGGTLNVSLASVLLDADDLDSKGLNLGPGEYVCFTVEDSGVGITPHVMGHIFDPYFTTKKKDKGTGLGLAVVYGIVTGYGGDITVSSIPGEGSVFEVYLPKIESTGEDQSEEEDASFLGGDERILFVDDENVVVQMAAELLGAMGYEVTVATSGEEALEGFQETPAYFDLVITDLTMPGITGIELARELMKIRPDIPLILCTGFSEDISEEEVKSLGFREYIKKPILRDLLAKAIRDILDGEGGKEGAGTNQ